MCTGGVWAEAPGYNKNKPGTKNYIHLVCGEAVPATTGFTYHYNADAGKKQSKHQYICRYCRTHWGRYSPVEQWNERLSEDTLYGWLVEIWDGEYIKILLIYSLDVDGEFLLGKVYISQSLLY